jgi:hypothetical protein
MDGLGQTVRHSKRFDPNRLEPILDGFLKPFGINSGRFGPKPSKINSEWFEQTVHNFIFLFFFPVSFHLLLDMKSKQTHAAGGPRDRGLPPEVHKIEHGRVDDEEDGIDGQRSNVTVSPALLLT